MTSMNNLNNVKRVKYTQNKSDCFISLQEYIMFYGDSTNEKYILFKFKNEVDQLLYGFSFELSQYNDVDKLIEKSVLTKKNLKIENLTSFVPDNKLKLNKDCDHISIEIISASFERMNFAHGVTTEVKFDFEDYKRSLKEEEVVVPKKTKRELRKENKEYNKTSNDLSTTKIKNITKQNKTRKPYRFAVLFGIVLIVFMFITVDYQIKNTSGLTADGITYRIDNHKKASIVSYNGSYSKIVIPNKIIIDNRYYPVTQIKANAFKGNIYISEIVFETDGTNSLTVNSGAFASLSNLQTVTQNGNGNIDIYSNAFYNSKNIVTFNCSGANLYIYAFSKLENLTYLKFKGVANCSQLYLIFRDVESNSDLHTFTYSSTITDPNFTEGFGE